MKLRDYQKEAYDSTLEAFQNCRSALAVMATGLGKCFAKGTPIMLYDGTVIPVEEVRVNDVLMGPDSKYRLVKSTCKGREMMYKVTPVKGDSYTVNESHILSLKITGLSNSRKKYVTDSNGNKYTNGDIANIDIKTYLASSKTFKHCAKGYRAKVEEFQRSSLTPINPYIAGVWLGDGHTRCANITTMDKEVVAELERYAENNWLHLNKLGKSGKAWTYGFSQKMPMWNGNNLRNFIHYYRLNKGKYIPQPLKVSSVNERLELLAGMIDTDGSLSGGGYDYISKRRQLAEDFAFVARSVGLAAYLKPCKKTCGNNGKTGTYYRVQISGDISIIPCRIPHKKASPRKQIKDVLVTGIKVEKLKTGDYYGFTLDGPDRRFLLGDFTVAHNTVYFSHVVNHFRKSGRIMVVAHREELITQAQDKMGTITGYRADIEMGDQWAMEGLTKAPLVVSTIQSQIAGREGGRMTRFNPNEFSLLVIDEAHHAPADTYRRVIDYYSQNSNLKVLGVTATPDRKDEKAMGAIFDTVAFEYDIKDGIEDGWLVPIHQQSVFVKGLDFSNVRKTAGELNGKDLAEVLEFEENIHGIAGPTVELTENKKSLVFAASVAQAERLTEIINRHKNHSAKFVCGTTPKEIRREMFADFAQNKFQYLVNVGVATEGFDDPGLQCVVLARPTASRSLYTQMVGRGTRPLPGLVDQHGDSEARRKAILSSIKPNIEILDFVGNAGKHKLICPADILGGDYEDDVLERAKEIAQNESDKKKKPVDVAGALEQAEREIAKERARTEDAAYREKIKPVVKYMTKKYNPFDMFDIEPRKEKAQNRDKPPTQRQIQKLRKFGIDTDGLTKEHAGQVLSECYSRIEKGACTYKQGKVLKRYGYDITQMTFGEASKTIDEIAKNGWKKPERRKVS